jgi:hypothetical protein
LGRKTLVIFAHRYGLGRLNHPPRPFSEFFQIHGLLLL